MDEEWDCRCPECDRRVRRPGNLCIDCWEIVEEYLTRKREGDTMSPQSTKETKNGHNEDIHPGIGEGR